MNQVTLIGRLARDASVQQTKSGGQVALFTLAVDNGVDANGKERASFIPCRLVGKSVGGVSKYLVKGRQVSFSGRLDVYQSTKEKLSNGYPVTMFTVQGWDLELLGSRNDGQPSANANSGNTAQKRQSRPQSARPATTAEFGNEGGYTEDDIQF